MFARLVYESFRRQKQRKLLAGAAITLGVAVTTAMIGVATDIGDKIKPRTARGWRQSCGDLLRSGARCEDRRTEPEAG